MSIDTTLQTLLRELMGGYDASIDVSDGSSFDTAVGVPFLTRIGGSPLEGDLEAFLVERLGTEIPDLDLSDAADMRNLVVRAVELMFEPLRREIRAVKAVMNLDDYAQMTREELDGRLSNFFLSIQNGGTATGTVRVFYSSPQSAVFTSLTEFSTGANLKFFPSVTQVVTATTMSFQQSGDLYYVDVSVEAEGTGSEYAVAIGAINSVTGLAGVSRVTNLSAFATVTDDETKEEAVARARDSITQRNIVTGRGIRVVLPESFADIENIQVIRSGDDEMTRDIIYGPVSISGIPGGVRGSGAIALAGGEAVHVGGFTDVYVFRGVPTSETLDVENLTDVGYRIKSGDDGYTLAGGTTTIFNDDYGNFLSNKVLPGDVLRLGAEERVVVTVSEATLDLDATLAGGLFAQTYEVVRQVAGRVTVPLYDLISEDAAGTPVVDTAGDPIRAVPGDDAKGQLLVAGVPQVATVNKSQGNVDLPLVRLESIEFLDSLSLEPQGIFVPMAEPLNIAAQAAFTGGDGSNPATGTVRVYFRDAVNAWVDKDSPFVGSTISFRPTNWFATTARVDAAPGSVVILEGSDFTSQLAAGYRITTGGLTLTVVSSVYSAPNTNVTVRETIASTFTTTAATVNVGIAEAAMPQDTVLGLYYFDVPVTATVNGASGNLAVGTALSAPGLLSEGWWLRSSFDVHSFSMRDLPYLAMSDWVNDSTEVGDEAVDYAFRLTYDAAPTLSAVQDYVDDDDNEVPSEDVLIRHFFPAYVRGTFVVENIVGATSKGLIEAYINALDPTAALQFSDVVDDLYSKGGATKVDSPVTLIGLVQAEDRSWTFISSEDELSSNRVQHYLADSLFIVTS